MEDLETVQSGLQLKEQVHTSAALRPVGTSEQATRGPTDTAVQSDESLGDLNIHHSKMDTRHLPPTPINTGEDAVVITKASPAETSTATQPRRVVTPSIGQNPSSFSGIVTSPLIASSATASRPLLHSPNLFPTPVLPAVSTIDTNVTGLVSPLLSIGNQMTPSHLPMFGPPFTGQATLPTQQAFSPQKPTYSERFVRGRSPAVPGTLQQIPSFSSQFDFSTSRPAPVRELAQERETSPTGDTVVHNRIFGSIDLSEIVKPRKQSRAIPTVHPAKAAKHELDVELEYDASDNQITQGAAPRKRGRIAAGGDEVPRFAQLPGSSVIAVNDNLENSPRFAPVTHMSLPLRPPPLQFSASPNAVNAKLSLQKLIEEALDIPWHFVESNYREIHKDVHETGESRILGPVDTLTQENAKSPSEDLPSSPIELASPDTESTKNDSVPYDPFQELGAIMDCSNKGDAKIGLRSPTHIPQLSIAFHSPDNLDKFHGNGNIESEHFSDDTELHQKNRHSATMAPDAASGTDEIFASCLSDQRDLRATQHAIRGLGNASPIPTSDWEDILSADEGLKIPTNSKSGDAHIVILIESLLERHFDPFKKSLRVVRAGIKKLLGRDAFSEYPSLRSGEKSTSGAGEWYNGNTDEDNDDTAQGFHRRLQLPINADVATDETDTDLQRRSLPLKFEMKLKKMESFMLEVIESSQAYSLSRLKEEPELRHEAMHRAKEFQSLLDLLEGDITMLAAYANSTQAKCRILKKERNQAEYQLASLRSEKNVAAMGGKIIKEAVEPSDKTSLVSESERNEAEHRVSGIRKLLELSEKEIVLFKESSKINENDLRVIRHEQEQAHQWIAALEESERELRYKNSGLSAQIVALEGTLDEYRTSSTNWRREIDEANQEKNALNTSLENLRTEAGDHQRIRTDLTRKLEVSQKAILSAANNLADERAIWTRKDEEHVNRLQELEQLKLRLDEDAKIRINLETRVEQLKLHQKSAFRTSVALEVAQQTNADLEAALRKLSKKTAKHQRIPSRLGSETSEARGSPGAESQQRSRIGFVRLIQGAEWTDE